jgi:hypothetical protein
MTALRAFSMCFLLAACGGSVSGTDRDSGAADSGTVPTADGGTIPDDSGQTDPDAGVDADVPFPAPHPAAPQVITFGGNTLSSPTIIPVFYPGDPLQSKIEAMLQALPQSQYWTAISQEYNIGSITIGKSIVVSEQPPNQIDDFNIAQWLQDNADGMHSPWPKAAFNQMFAIFYPQSTTITLQNTKSCYGFGGYHEEAIYNGTNFPYAVIPRCGGGGTLTALDEVTVALSHEIIEASTDPYVQSSPAYQAVDFDHYTWSWFPGGEVGDMCAFERQANQPLVGNFLVQRSWSNQSAKASHDPCVPALNQPYFNSAPSFKDTIKIGFGGGSITTKGAKIPVGQMKTVDVYLFSDAATSPWTVQAIDTATLQGLSPELGFAWDKTSGKNGDILHLTISALKASQYGVSLFLIRSAQQSGTEHMWYGTVGN